MAATSQIDSAVRILLSAKDNASPEIDRVKKSLSGIDTQATATGAAVRAGLGGAFAALTGILADSARAAAAEEVGMQRLQGAVENAGLSYDKLGDAIEKKIAAQIRTTAFADDQQRDSLSTLIGLTKDANEAFRLQALAMDLARAKGIDLALATAIVAKVSQGNVAILKRYAIAVKEGATATEGLAAIQEISAGASERYASGTQGALDIIKIELGNLQENFGGVLGPLSTFIAMLPGLSPAAIGVGSAIGFLTSSNEKFTLSATKGLIVSKLAAAMGKLRAAALATAGAMRVLSLAMVTNPIGLIIAAVAALGIAMYVLYQKVEPVRNVMNFLWNELVKVIGPLGKVVAVIGGALKGAWDTVSGAIGGVGGETKDAEDQMKKFGSSGKAAAEKIMTAMETLRSGALSKGAEGLEDLLTQLGISKEQTAEVLAAAEDVVGLTQEQIKTVMRDRALAKADTLIFQSIGLDKQRELVADTGKVIADLEGDFKDSTDAVKKAKIGSELEQQRALLATQALELKRLEALGQHANAILKSGVAEKTFNENAIARHSAAIAKVHEQRDAVLGLQAAYAGIANIVVPGRAGGDSHDRLTKTDEWTGPSKAMGGWVTRTEPTLVHKGEYVVPRDQTGSMGAVTISPSITLNYTGSGAADTSVAANMAQAVIDQVTESLRQQSRRVGNRLSPFGAS